LDNYIHAYISRHLSIDLAEIASAPGNGRARVFSPKTVLQLCPIKIPEVAPLSALLWSSLSSELSLGLMNTTGCPPGWATDEFLMLGEAPGRCDMSVGVTSGLVSLILFLQIIAATGQTHLWVRREQRAQRDSSSRSLDKPELFCGRRFPLVPINAWLNLAILAVLVGLILAGFANNSTGVLTFLLGLIITNYCLVCFMLLTKFISLGHNMLGSRKSKWAAQKLKDDNRISLTKLTPGGRVATIISILALTGSFVSFCIFGLIYPNKSVRSQDGAKTQPSSD
jgi:hypothetical protein